MYDNLEISFFCKTAMLVNHFLLQLNSFVVGQMSKKTKFSKEFLHCTKIG